MGFFSHLGGGRLGTQKNGASANMGLIAVSQSFPVTFAADGTVTTGVNIPAGSQILHAYIDVTTAFNAATTNTIQLGVTSGGSELLAATSVSAAGRVTAAPSGTALSTWLNIGTSDVTVYATFHQTGVVATAGAATITISYIVRNADGTTANPA